MNIKEKLAQYLRNIQILTNEEIQIILDATIVEGYKKGDLLLKEGQKQTQCYMILEGCVREYIVTDGSEKTTAFYTEGEKIISYTSEGKKSTSSHYLECMEDTIVTISTQNFEDELRGLIPRLDAIIQQIAREQLENNKNQITSFIASSPEERYKELLENRPSLFNRVPQHQIASYLGVKPESLSRIRKRIHHKLKQNPDSVQD